MDRERSARGPAVDHLARLIARAVVADEDLARRHGLAAERCQPELQLPGLVVGADEDARVGCADHGAHRLAEPPARGPCGVSGRTPREPPRGELARGAVRCARSARRAGTRGGSGTFFLQVERCGRPWAPTKGTGGRGSALRSLLRRVHPPPMGQGRLRAGRRHRRPLHVSGPLPIDASMATTDRGRANGPDPNAGHIPSASSACASKIACSSSSASSNAIHSVVCCSGSLWTSKVRVWTSPPTVIRTV